MPVLMIGEVPNLTRTDAGMLGQLMPFMRGYKGFISHAALLRMRCSTDHIRVEVSRR